MNVNINEKPKSDEEQTSDNRHLTEINSWRTAWRSLLMKLSLTENFLLHSTEVASHPLHVNKVHKRKRKGWSCRNSLGCCWISLDITVWDVDLQQRMAHEIKSPSIAHTTCTSTRHKTKNRHTDEDVLRSEGRRWIYTHAARTHTHEKINLEIEWWENLNFNAEIEQKV